MESLSILVGNPDSEDETPVLKHEVFETASSRAIYDTIVVYERHNLSGDLRRFKWGKRKRANGFHDEFMKSPKCCSAVYWSLAIRVARRSL
jgi:hypothetical protein